MSSNARRDFCGRTRREFLWETGCGFGAAALASLLSGDGFFSRRAEAAPKLTYQLAVKPPLLPAKAKSVIFLFMYGGPSHIDTFDYKPAMVGRDGKTIEVKTFGRGGHKNQGRIVEPRWTFRQRGECGKYVSDLFPHLGDCVDDIAFMHSMTAESPIHGSGLLMMNSGRLQSGSPALGSWVNYGLGSVSDNLPGVCSDAQSRGRADQRVEELVERIHPRKLRGYHISRRGFAHQRSFVARRHDKAAGTRPARYARANERASPRGAT